MKKVYQTRFGKNNGNCFAACVASLLELSIEDVDFDMSSDYWIRDGVIPVLDKLGYVYLELPFNPEKDTLHTLPDNMFFIVAGKSPGKDYNHAEIVRYKPICNGMRYELHWEHNPSGDSAEHVQNINSIGFLLNKRIHSK